MSNTITNNLASLSLQRANSAMNRTLERLSTSARASDAQANALLNDDMHQMAALKAKLNDNANAVGFTSKARESLNAIKSLLTKARELAVQGASADGGNQAAFSNILEAVDAVATQSAFSEKRILDGSAGVSAKADNASISDLRTADETKAGSYAIEVTTAAERGTVSATRSQAQALAQDETLSINGVSIELKKGFTQKQVVEAINASSEKTGVIADANGLAGTTRLSTNSFGEGAKLEVKSSVAAASDSSGFGTEIRKDSGTDISGTIDGVKAQGKGKILSAHEGAAKGLTVVVGADTKDSMRSASGALGKAEVSDSTLVLKLGANEKEVQLALPKLNTDSLGATATSEKGLSGVSLKTADGARDAIAVIDRALATVDTLSSKVGNIQNKVIALSAAEMQQNLASAQSSIVDSGFAEEMASLAKHQVLSSGGMAISSVNANAQILLSLLR